MRHLLTSLLVPALTLSAAVATAQTPCPTSPVADHGKPLSSNDGKLASPAAVASTPLDGKTIEIKYNTPSIRCRTVFGGLVPYDKVWRTGANPATSLHTEVPLKFGTLTVPAGDHTIYTLPRKGQPWLLIINNQTGQWGTVYDQSKDLGRTPMQRDPKTMANAQEVMTISFEHTTQNTTQLHIRWEKVDEFVDVSPAK